MNVVVVKSICGFLIYFVHISSNVLSRLDNIMTESITQKLQTMKNKPKIIGIIIFNFAFLCIAGIALRCKNVVAAYPDLQEPRTETWTEQEEPASVAQMYNSMNLEFHQPINLAKSKSGEHIVKVRIGDPIVKLSIRN